MILRLYEAPQPLHRHVEYTPLYLLFTLLLVEKLYFLEFLIS